MERVDQGCDDRGRSFGCEHEYAHIGRPRGCVERVAVVGAVDESLPAFEPALSDELRTGT